MPKVFEITLNNGVDPRTGKTIGLKHGRPGRRSRPTTSCSPRSRRSSAISSTSRSGATTSSSGSTPSSCRRPSCPSSSSDCVAKGKDYHAGGARYNTNYIQGVGLGSMTDILSAVKLQRLRQEDRLHEEPPGGPGRRTSPGTRTCASACSTRRPSTATTTTTPTTIMKTIFEAYFEAIDGRPTTKGGKYRINLLPTTVHVYFGKVTGATPDGRKAGEALSEGISPGPGRGPQGPHGRPQVGRQDGPRPDGRHAPQPEVHPPAPGRTTKASTTSATSSGRTSRWTATTSSSTWSRPTPCATPRSTPRSTAT